MPAKMKIRSAYSSLPSAERKVADFILENPDRAMHMVINEIAEASGVSVPSVTRLARKLGYKGFLEFRVALASGSAAGGEAHKLSPIDETDSDETVVDKLYSASIRALEDTYHALDTKRFCELSRTVANAKRVFFIAGSGSALIAEDCAYQLNSLDVEAIAITDQVVANMYKSRFTEGDVVIGLSRAGRNRQLSEALRTAKKQGAVSCLISNCINAQAAQTVDYFICASRVDDLKKLLGVESINAMVAISNLLITIVARNLNRVLDDSIEPKL